jgi:hypothetical protein
LRRSYAWSVPTPEALQCIAQHAHPHGLVEIGAGTGYWTRLLHSCCGVDVVAYDQTPCIDLDHAVSEGSDRQERLNGFHALAHGGNALPFAQVLRGDASRAADHPERCLFLCWPPKEDDTVRGLTHDQASMAADALRHFAGTTVAYVGCYAAGHESPRRALEGWGESPGVGAPEAPAAHSTEPAESSVGRSDTGGPAFHSMLEKEFECIETLELPSWPQLSERLTVWRRRACAGSKAPASSDAGQTQTPRPTFSAFEADVEAEIDEATRETTLAMLRSSFDREWMRGLFLRAARSKLGGGGGGEATASPAELRMLERCLGRISPSWLRRAGRVAQGWLM